MSQQDFPKGPAKREPLTLILIWTQLSPSVTCRERTPDQPSRSNILVGTGLAVRREEWEENRDIADRILWLTSGTKLSLVRTGVCMAGKVERGEGCRGKSGSWEHRGWGAALADPYPRLAEDQRERLLLFLFKRSRMF